MPVKSTEIKFKPSIVPAAVLTELDEALSNDWTLKEVPAGREIPLWKLIAKHESNGALIPTIIADIKFTYEQIGWDVSILREITGLFKPKGIIR